MMMPLVYDGVKAIINAAEEGILIPVKCSRCDSYTLCNVLFVPHTGSETGRHDQGKTSTKRTMVLPLGHDTSKTILRIDGAESAVYDSCRQHKIGGRPSFYEFYEIVHRGVHYRPH